MIVKRPQARSVSDLMKTHATLIDTSFLMEPGFAAFARTYLDGSSRPALIPGCVIQELERLSSLNEDERQTAAMRALRLVQKLRVLNRVEIRHEPSDTYADNVILRVVLQHFRTRDILVLTNDAGLMRDVYDTLKLNSVSTRKSLEVAKLHRRTQAVVFFRPDERSLRDWEMGEREGKAETPKPRLKVKTRPVPQLPPSVPPFATAQSLAVVEDRLLPTGPPPTKGSRFVLDDELVIELGDEIGSGGEGTIHEVVGRGEVAKLYSPGSLTVARRNKIELMVSRKVEHPSICWPTRLIRDQEGNFRGFLMPKAAGKRIGETIFFPKEFLTANPTWTRKDSVTLAIRILSVIETLHSLNILIGDVNPNNLLHEGANKVWLVDCDSFQVEGYPCPVGTTNFTAPEIQGRDFRTFLRTMENERFAVAPLVFMILFPGKTPYTHAGGGDGAANIKKMDFPYGRDKIEGERKAPLGIWTFCWSHLSFDLKNAMTRSFHASEREKPRLTASDWISLLQRYRRELDNPDKVFVGPLPKLGYDLSIMPRSPRYTPSTQHKMPRDGQTVYDLMLQTLTRQAAAQAPVSQPIPEAPAKPVPAATVASKPAATRPKATTPPPAKPSVKVVPPPVAATRVASRPAPMPDVSWALVAPLKLSMELAAGAFITTSLASGLRGVAAIPFLSFAARPQLVWLGLIIGLVGALISQSRLQVHLVRKCVVGGVVMGLLTFMIGSWLLPRISEDNGVLLMRSGVLLGIWLGALVERASLTREQASAYLRTYWGIRF